MILRGSSLSRMSSMILPIPVSGIPIVPMLSMISWILSGMIFIQLIIRSRVEGKDSVLSQPCLLRSRYPVTQPILVFEFTIAFLMSVSKEIEVVIADDTASNVVLIPSTTPKIVPCRVNPEHAAMLVMVVVLIDEYMQYRKLRVSESGFPISFVLVVRALMMSDMPVSVEARASLVSLMAPKMVPCLVNPEHAAMLVIFDEEILVYMQYRKFRVSESGLPISLVLVVRALTTLEIPVIAEERESLVSLIRLKIVPCLVKLAHTSIDVTLVVLIDVYMQYRKFRVSDRGLPTALVRTVRASIIDDKRVFVVPIDVLTVLTRLAVRSVAVLMPSSHVLEVLIAVETAVMELFTVLRRL